MAGQLPRPGVEVIEQFTSATPTIITPTLVPFVTGVAKEVIEVTTADGLVNSHAKQGTYNQLPKTISQSAFPSPRGNIAEVTVEGDTVKVFFLNGGLLQQLDKNPGSSFLDSWNWATSAVLDTKDLTTNGINISTTPNPTIVLAVDVEADLNTTQDVVITFVSTGDHVTPAQVAAQINNAVGETVATVISYLNGVKVRIQSPTVGAGSSVTIRAGGSANALLGFVEGDLSTPKYRVVGSGFRGQDQNNNTTLTPWVQWYRGGFFKAGAVTAWPTELQGTYGAGLMYDDNVTYIATYAPAVTFTGSGSIDLKVGDEFWADGVRPSSSYVMKVEANRFKLGTINSKLSTYDSSGNLVTAVYDASNVNTLYASVPFIPHYAWFKAKNLYPTLLPQAAWLKGTTEGSPAEWAEVDGTSGVTLPVSLAGLNLKFVVTVNGVVQDEQDFVFTGGPYASVGALVTAIGTNIPGVIACDLGSDKIGFHTTRTGALQGLQLLGTSTALVSLGFVASTDVLGTGKDVEFRDVPPAIRSSMIDPADLLDTMHLNVNISGDYDQLTHHWTVARVHAFAGGKTTIQEIIDEINADNVFRAIDSGTHMGLVAVGWSATGSAPWTQIVVKGVFDTDPAVTIQGSRTGLQFDTVASNCQSGGDPGLDFSTGGIAEDGGEENLSGLIFKFKFDNRPVVYQTIFTTDSLVDAVASINETVGFPVATISGTNSDELKLTSPLKGYASVVTAVVDPWTSGTRPLTQKACAALGFNIAGESTDDGRSVSLGAGYGRPNPDFYLDAEGNIVLGADILRNLISGEPYGVGTVPTYVQYTGLRRDLSPTAAKPGIISISDTTTLSSILNPISSKNPLGLGMFFMMINAPGLQCTAMGVDEASAAEPYGTPLAYSKVASWIQSEEVYAIAPLTHSELVAQIFMNHCNFMSLPEQKGERIVFINPAMPTRAVDDVILSGTGGETNQTPNQFIGDASPMAALVAAGINPQSEIPVSDDLFVEIEVVTPSVNEIRYYSVKSVNGVVWDFRTTFAAGENLDGFYTTTLLAESLVNAVYTMAVRGDLLLIPGSTLPDKDRIAATVAAKASVYKNRRVYYTFPDQCEALLGGTEELLPGFYMPAAIAGMVGAQPPQQGFTNLPMAGFAGVVGSNDMFNNTQLNIMAGGGTYIIVQDAQGGPLTSRHQLSTNLTSIETRELSITKDVDYVAKFLRTGLRNFIGTFNITQPFLDTLSTVIHGMNQFLEEQGIVISADINNIIQSKDQPDTVLVDETLNVPYPCNYIRLTLAI